MLTIYRSNKAEWLTEILGQELRLNPPEITEEVNIIVSTWPSSRWLSEKLSIITNINALVKYPFPGTYLKRLVKRIIGIDPDEKDPWEKNQLVWNILELLPELMKNEEAQVIRSWLKKSDKENDWHVVFDLGDEVSQTYIFDTFSEYEEFYNLTRLYEQDKSKYEVKKVKTPKPLVKK